MSKKTIYISIDNVSDGPMEIDEKKNLLTQIQDKYPDAKRAEPYEDGSPVIIVSTEDDDGA